MHRKSLWIIASFICLLGILNSEAQITLSGTVLDSITRKPMPNTNIIVEHVSRGTMTDESGNFKINNLTTGRISLRISHLSHEEIKLSFNLESSTVLPVILLKPRAIQLEDVFITADRLRKRSEEVPATLYSIDGRKAQVYSVQNADELFMMIPGIRIDRDRGIFSKNSSISMRGLNGSARALVLLDGAPINKADGAGINWNRIDPDNIERIEVMKGPNSTIYGSNAMAGVVNIITAKDALPFRMRVKTFYGTYQTCGGSISGSGSRIRDGKGWYWSANNFYRRGNGYIPIADSLRDTLDAKTYLSEVGSSLRLGYQFSRDESLEVEYNYYWDKRGDGTFIFEPGGSYNQYPSHFTRLNYKSVKGKWQTDANAFFQLEHYKRQNETIKKQTGKYTLYQTDSKRVDAGLWITAARSLKHDRRLIVGLDFKKGSVDASDIYFSSTDILTNKGQMDLGAVFLQLESPLPLDHLSVEAGIRMDAARFHGGSFTIEDPTALTEFMSYYPTNFKDSVWIAASPRVALLYRPKPWLKTYLSFAHGFRPPTLDDMCRNGNITKGFKLANPALAPEHLNNFEAGYTARLGSKLEISQSVFFSAGKDFQYFVANGDSVYTGGNNLKPVLQRQNISKAHCLGTEISAIVTLNQHFYGFVNYAYNHSVIASSESSAGKSLEGKRLMEVPANQASAGLEYRYNWLMAGINYAYTGEIFADDDNLVVNPARNETGLRISFNYHEKTYLGISINDLFNHRYIDSKGNISPGRFVMCSLVWKFESASSLK